MSFKYPPFFSYLEQKEIKGLNDIVQTLNRMLARCDQEIGCPFKAVSYHGKIEEKKLLEWEMIVDV